jgi:NAD(P)-dependent dehydrogenase (short-subunit alcohol dehydrogenase family)
VRLSGNTILITGGTSDIGLELAMRRVALDNTVIVTERSRSKLDAAREMLAIACWRRPAARAAPWRGAIGAADFPHLIKD